MTMNGFEKHGIRHTSATSINKWIEAPCAWIAQYLYGRKSPFGAAAAAGTFTEQAITDIILNGMEAQEAITKAIGDWNTRFPLCFDESAIKRRDAIPSMVENALAELSHYGTPERAPEGNWNGQHEININCNGDGWVLPIKGYLDFWFPHHGLIVDLKTTFRMPSELSASHKRQAGIYSAAMGNQAVKFLYVTPKKAGWLDAVDIQETLAEIKGVLNRQEKFLQLGDKELLKSIVPVNLDTFYWSDDLATRKELYGI